MKNLLIMCLVFCSIFSCDKLDRIEGMGPIVEEILEVDDFTGVALNAAANVTLTQGDKIELIVKGHQNIIDRLKTKVNNQKLKIDLENGSYNNYELDFFITVTNLDFIGIDGAGDFNVNEFTIEELYCHIDGAGNLNFNSELIIEKSFRVDIDGAGDTYVQDLKTKEVMVNMDGAGDITLRGKAPELEVNIDGVGDVSAFALDSELVKVTVNGLGKTEVTAEDELDVNIDGIGNVYYKGDPTIYKDIDGIGRLYDAN